MKYGLILLSFLISSFLFAQKTFVETGRPKTFLVQNAQEIAGKKLKVKYAYVPFSSTMEQLDSIRLVNNATSDYMFKKHGADWERKLANAIQYEIENFGTFIGMLTKANLITTNNLVYFKKSVFGTKYTAFIYPDIAPETRSKKNLKNKVVFRVKDGKATMK